MNKSEIEFVNEQSNKMSDLMSREALFKCFQKQAMTLYGKNVVEAENEEEAIEKATHEIELDVDPSVEPLVTEWEDDEVSE